MADETRELRRRYALGALRGVVAAGEDLLGEAQRRAPVEEGTLRGSGTLVLIVNGSRFEGAGARGQAEAAVRAAAEGGGRLHIDAEVSFNTVYAARQHEELGWSHPKGGQAKYLESVLAERAGRYEHAIGLAAKRGID